MSLIVFEGLDCTGKTSLAKRVVEELNNQGITAIYNKGITDHSSKGRRKTTNDFLVELLRNEAEIVRPNLDAPNTAVVQDRNYLSIVSYCAAKTGAREYEWIDSFFRKPELVVYLCAGGSVRQTRWESEGRRGFSELVENLELAKAVNEEYMRRLQEYNACVFDTSGMSVEQSFKALFPEILKEISKEI